MAGIEVIKRSIDGNVKTSFRGNPQISYNDYGHLVVRGIVNNNEDFLIVFDQHFSQRIMNFIRNYIR